METNKDPADRIEEVEKRIEKLEKDLKKSVGVALIAALFFSIIF